MSRLTWVRQSGDYGAISVTGLSPSVVRLSRRFTYRSGSLGRLLRVIPMTSLNPEGTRVHSVWAVPLSLATTDGIADCFLFLRVLRCFTSPGLPPATMDSSRAEAVLPATGFPIRTSTDQNLVSGSPWLIAATHVLHRLLEPRHPPHALSSLVTLDSSLPSFRSDDARSRPRSRSFGDTDPSQHMTSLFDAFLPFVFGCQRARMLRRATCGDAGNPRSRNEPGGADRNRTDDIQLAKLALYQLSYSPTKRWSPDGLVGLGGFEPPTSRLSGVRSRPTEL